MHGTDILQQLGRALDRAFATDPVIPVTIDELPALGCTVTHATIGAEMLRLARRNPAVLVLPCGELGRTRLDDLPAPTFETPAGRTVIYRRQWFELEAG